MSKIRYFAYGSNMLTAWLQSRCKSARATGVASAVGFRLAFSKRSKDGSGKAMLVAADGHEALIYGVLYDIDSDEIDALDQAEGRGNGYERVEGFAVRADGDSLAVTTYMADNTAIGSVLKPYDWYLRLTVKGAEQHGLPGDYIDGLRATMSIPDPNPQRPTQKKALTILKERP
jgi:gamma-glutamylcyclotransferase